MPEELPAQITQADLRNRSAEILRAVESGMRFAVTRNGRHIGDLVPAGRRSSFVSRAEFAARSKDIPLLNGSRFRDDLSRYVTDDIYGL